MTFEERKENLRIEFDKDVEYFKQMLEELDSNGCFNDRFPNDGIAYETEDMLDSILRFEDCLSDPANLAFWR
ncbi:MAG: hypothetical protein FWG90_09475 [Oscillospiraceae bacterium]|nr:hypothetical protein [Oscillospiraceae bacterium]